MFQDLADKSAKLLVRVMVSPASAPNSTYTKLALRERERALDLTVISSVCPTDGGRVPASLPSRREGVGAEPYPGRVSGGTVHASNFGSGGVHREPGERLEVQPEGRLRKDAF